MRNLTLCILVLALLEPNLAHAYLDPGTGSMIIQMAIAGILGAVLYVKLAWANTKRFLSRLVNGNTSTARSQEHDPEESGHEPTRDPD